MASSPNGLRPSDKTLMKRAQEGDCEAFAQLYDRHAVRAFRVARAICGDIGRAEDAVQEGFLTIWKSRTQFHAGKGSFQAWAMAIVKNRAIDSYRAATSRPPLQANGSPTEPPDAVSKSAQDQVVARSEADALLSSLRELPDRQAEVIALAYFGELSHLEIAAQLELPAGTVKGRMRLGLEKLRKQMGAET
jgi:RNA polymerase sigma-70 factor (ECF subfamily)